MFASLIQYVRQHHLGLVAVFIAATGTAYATTLPRNSVGTKQVVNRSLLKRDFKRGVFPRALNGVEGPEGPEGPRGPEGPEGPPGPAASTSDDPVTSSDIFDGTIGLNDLAAETKDGTGNVATLRSLGTGAHQAAAGDDPRLSDARTPAGAAGGDLTGTYPNPTVANSALGSAEIVAASSANGLRRSDLGVVSTQALSVDPPAITALTCSIVTVTLTGIATDDTVLANPKDILGNAVTEHITAYALDGPSANLLDIVFCNGEFSTINPPARDWNVLVFR